MPFFLNPWGLPGIAAGVLALLLVPLIQRYTPDRALRGRLVALLVVEAMTVATSGAGLAAMSADARTAYAVGLLHMVGDALLLALYVPFLSHALDHPFTRRLRGGGEYAFMFAGSALAALALLRPVLFQGPPVPIEGVSYGRFLAPEQPLWAVVAILLALMYALGLVLALLTWRSAQTELARRRARTFALAFGTRDLVWGGIYALGMAGFAMSDGFFQTLLVVYAGSLAVYLLLLGYGLFTTQLFDMDLRLKWTVRQGTVAAVFVAVFFFVSEAATVLLSDRLGPLLGILATSLLIFVLEPLQRLGARISSAALPNVHDTADYAAFKKLQVYHAALESAYASGGVTPRERVILESLCKSLDISAADARRLEADFQTTSS